MYFVFIELSILTFVLSELHEKTGDF